MYMFGTITLTLSMLLTRYPPSNQNRFFPNYFGCYKLFEKKHLLASFNHSKHAFPVFEQ